MGRGALGTGNHDGGTYCAGMERNGSSWELQGVGGRDPSRMDVCKRRWEPSSWHACVWGFWHTSADFSDLPCAVAHRMAL